jgi:hypothetical protein
MSAIIIVEKRQNYLYNSVSYTVYVYDQSHYKKKAIETTFVCEKNTYIPPTFLIDYPKLYLYGYLPKRYRFSQHLQGGSSGYEF